MQRSEKPHLILYFDNKDHAVGIAAYAEHTGNLDLLNNLDYTDNPIVKLFQEHEELKMQNKALKDAHFNSEEHYKVLKENYDDVFKYISAKVGGAVEQHFDAFKEWTCENKEECNE